MVKQISIIFVFISNDNQQPPTKKDQEEIDRINLSHAYLSPSGQPSEQVEYQAWPEK